MGNRFFVTPGNYLNSYVPNIVSDKRTKPISIRYGYSQQDSITYNYTETYYPEGLPEDIQITTKFGEYEKRVIPTNGKVELIRTFIIYDGIYPVEDFEEFKKFINSVNKSDNEKIVLISKT